MRRKLFWWITLSAIISSCSLNMPDEVATAYKDLPEQIDFNFHIKPLLSDRCYTCHGPDENSRKADLRLDLETEAFKKLASGNFAIKAGNPSASESIRRILSEDPEVQMPPPEAHLSLSATEKALIIKWIEQGAQWKKHWAFSKPENPAIPSIDKESWPAHNAVDNFVQQKLLLNKLEPAPAANKERLLRRVSMDLTGLPPSIAEIDAFLNDNSETAYEQVVDRLLASDANAERLALDWMDISRYADSHGLHADGWRLMWPWRDWVINAFKDNMPYDQFVSWQLAGDLFPEATREQKLATAFNRNHPMTAEGGAIEEEFRLNYVWDRTETVGTALLGLTINCARCHDHKYDPISQKDYYQLASFFNNVKELGMTGDDGNYGPMLALPDAETESELEQLDAKIKAKEQQLKITKKELLALEKYMAKLPGDFSKKGLLAHFPFDKLQKRTGKRPGYIVDGSTRATSREAPILTEGVQGKALEFTGEYDEVYLHELPNFEWTDPFSASLWMNTTKRETGLTQTLMGTSGQKNNFWRGWDFYLDSLNHLNARLIHSLPHNYIHVRSKDSIKTNTWKHVAFTYDGSGKAKGLNLFIDGKDVATTSPYDRLYKSIKTVRNATHEVHTELVRVAKSYRAFTGENGIFKGRLDDIYMYSRALTGPEIAALAKREDAKQQTVPQYWVSRDPQVDKQEKELAALREQWLEKMQPVMEVMVMEEMPETRTAYLYSRGDYTQPMEEVATSTPEALPAFPESYPRNRVGLAQWIFAEENPLTARVAVNRYWQMLFGNGLVSTPQDFGVQGALPSHPELLDWLAITFQESNWDVKALLKTIVMSHTYRQSSTVSEALREKDPGNKLLARANSYRLPAEMIRDNALAASGLLVNQVGGESVKPYQPGKLWIEKNSFSHKLLNYEVTKGDSLYRRGLYTFIRRTAPHPAMTAFDVPSREVCIVKRENTNTPLQALILLNDTQFVEASKILAERMQKEGGDSIEQQISYGFRLAVSRAPKKQESEILRNLYERQSERFKANPKEASAFLAIGEKAVDKKLNNDKTAALAIVANTILNHDETYMKR